MMKSGWCAWVKVHVPFGAGAKDTETIKIRNFVQWGHELGSWTESRGPKKNRTKKLIVRTKKQKSVLLDKLFV